MYDAKLALGLASGKEILRHKLVLAVNSKISDAGLLNVSEAYKAVNHEIKARFGERDHLSEIDLQAAIEFVSNMVLVLVEKPEPVAELANLNPEDRLRNYLFKGRV